MTQLPPSYQQFPPLSSFSSLKNSSIEAIPFFSYPEFCHQNFAVLSNLIISWCLIIFAKLSEHIGCNCFWSVPLRLCTEFVFDMLCSYYQYWTSVFSIYFFPLIFCPVYEYHRCFGHMTWKAQWRISRVSWPL